MQEINNIGLRFFTLLMDAGYWAILIVGVTAVLKSAMRGDFDGAFQAGFKAAVAYLGLLLLPVLMNMIKGAFS